MTMGADIDELYAAMRRQREHYGLDPDVQAFPTLEEIREAERQMLIDLITSTVDDGPDQDDPHFRGRGESELIVDVTGLDVWRFKHGTSS